MTDVSKYRNVSLSNETYKGGHLLSTKMFKGLQVSMSQLIDALVAEKIKDLKLEKELKEYRQPTRRVSKKKNLMAKLKTNSLRKRFVIIVTAMVMSRVAVGNTSIDFRDNSQVHQCWVCDSEGEVYEERTDLINDNPFSNKLH